MIANINPYPEMKNTGLPWAGKVPSHWELVPNRALLRKRKVLVGDRHTDYRLLSLTKSGVIVRDISTGRGKFSADMGTSQEVRDGDIVFCLFDVPETPRTVGLSKYHGMVTGAYTVFECNDKQLARFLEIFYIAMDDRKLLGPLYTGLRNTIPPPVLLGQKTPLPPASEQAAIVRFLDHADRKIRRYIRAKQKLIKLLEEQKQAIIHRAVTRGLDPNVRLKPSGVQWLGDIPEHWEVWRISRFATVGNGSTPSRGESKYWSPSDYPWLNSSQINRGLIDSADQFVSMLALHDCHLPKVTPGSILVAITGQGRTRGKSAILGIEATINQHIAYLSLRLQIASPEFVNLVLTAAYTHLRKISDDSGSTKGALTCEDLKRLKIPIPPHGEQRVLLARTQSAITETINTISRLEREIAILREYRTRLIADVVTGKLDVREAAAQLPVEEQELQLVDELDDTNETEEDTLDDLDGSPEEAET